MTDDHRPLSPHLQVYRPQITSVTSIAHRAAGVALALGLLLVVWWLIAAAAGANAYATVQAFTDSAFGRLILFGWTLALFYHLCNGVRHLFWDAGRGFDLPTARATGWLAAAAAVVLTLAAWVWGYASLGAFG